MSRSRPAPRGVFVTGTDTGVGKTLVACALAAWARQRGRDIGVMKPVATGARPLGRSKELVSDDARMLALAAGCQDPWSLIGPVCFAQPLAPLTAARRAGRTIRLGPVLQAFGELSSRHRVMVVEGVGGLLVPLSGKLTVADMARAMGLPLVVVARAELGTLNHTLMTLACARAAGLRIAGVVCTRTVRAPNAMGRTAARSNPALIRELGRVPLLGVLPYDPRCASRFAKVRVEGCAGLSRSLDSGMLSRLI